MSMQQTFMNSCGGRAQPLAHFFISAVSLLSLIGWLGGTTKAWATPLVFYFDKTTSTNDNSIGAFVYDENTHSFWTTGFGATGQIRNIAYNGSSWAPTGSTGPFFEHVTGSTWANYNTSDGTIYNPVPNENPWSPSQPIVGGMLLNPKPITLNGNTYPAGSLMLINASNSVISTPSPRKPEHTKRLYWYNMTETGINTPTGNGTGMAPDVSTDYNSNGVVDWNDQFMTVLNHQDLEVADGDFFSSTFASNLQRSASISTDGQSLYMLDSGSNLGGIFKVDLTSVGQVTKVLDADSTTTSERINTEPGVVPTSIRDFTGGTGTGDQIIVEGSTSLGNAGGLNAYLDDGTTFSTSPHTVLTAAQFQAFADLAPGDLPGFLSVTSDSSGNLYFFEDEQWDAIYRLDTEGRLLKLVSAAERSAFRIANSAPDNYNATVRGLQVRTNNENGFPVQEVFYIDASFDAPLGVMAFKPGDVNQDNVVDATEKAAFLAALKPRGDSTSDSSLYVFDLNGTSSGSTSAHSAIVDWKDVKVFQQFEDIPDGDTNFDGLLDFTDLTTMSNNYYTLGGPADKTWAQGDFASLDPFATIYDALASDANIVDEVDLQLVAYTWLDVLDQENITFADLDLYGYSGQFRLDVIEAFGLNSSSSSAIPEPSSMVLLLCGLGAGMYRRRRAVTNAA